MTAWFEGDNGFYLGAKASLIEDDREVAGHWSSQHVKPNSAHKWTLGRFVEADKANSNRQLFTLDGLQMARPSIQHAPMNMNHEYRHVVGAFVAAELIYPTDEIAASVTNPYIEALGVFWRHYFRDEYRVVEAAHAEGRLFYSMECIPKQVECAGEGGCGGIYEYAGRVSDTYCSHLNETSSDKKCIDPHFTAGAIIVPPVRPGWKNADIHSLVAAHAALSDDIREGVSKELPHLEESDWESMMHQLLTFATR